MINDPDAIVIGSGAGGATVARELTKAGKKVALLERGRNHSWIGNSIAASRYIDRLGMRKSREGLMIVRALTTGGSTLIYGACATRPPEWLSSKYGIDLKDEAKETEEELNIRPTPEHLIGPGVRRVMDAANRLGFQWRVFPKFVDHEKCVPDCSDCILGCRRGAKWTARRFIEEARENGCSLYTEFKASHVITKKGQAAGVCGLWRNRPTEIFAKTVVVAAGGLETPSILQRSGLSEAGQNFFCDPMAFVYGTIDGRKNGHDIPNTAGSFKYHDTEGIFLADHADPRFIFPMQMLIKGVQYLPRCLRYDHTIGILVKIKDSPGGRINGDGTFSKPMTHKDKGKIARGIGLATKILIEAGANPVSIMSTPIRGAHPGGTAAINRVVDRDLETRIRNLYVSDASVLPESMASPQVLTIISLAKRLARHLESIL
jgi:choline dehydrogenase-like flavoprotein